MAAVDPGRIDEHAQITDGEVARQCRRDSDIRPRRSEDRQMREEMPFLEFRHVNHLFQQFGHDGVLAHEELVVRKDRASWGGARTPRPIVLHRILQMVHSVNHNARIRGKPAGRKCDREVGPHARDVIVGVAIGLLVRTHQEERAVNVYVLPSC